MKENIEWIICPDCKGERCVKCANTGKIPKFKKVLPLSFTLSIAVPKCDKCKGKGCEKCR